MTVDRAAAEHAIRSVFARIEVRVVRQVEAPAESFSPNAYKRNDWKPREKVSWSVEAWLDGVDVSELIEPTAPVGGVYRQRKIAEAAAAETVAALSDLDREKLGWWFFDWVDGRLDSPFAEALPAALAAPSPAMR